MSWSKCAPLLLLAGSATATEGYLIGAGLEGDSSDGIAATAMAGVGLGETTWLSAALARQSIDAADRLDVDSWYADFSVDHWFDPLGVRLGAAYWGDSDSLESNDLRASFYWREKRFSIAGDYEYRDFTVELPDVDRFPRRSVSFDATGVGLSARFDVSDVLSVRLSGMDYDYNANLRLDSNRALLQLLAFSRLSLINSLADRRISAGFGLEVGAREWLLDLGTWKGEVDGGTSRSLTLSLLNPLGDSSDAEFAVGWDDSDLYGNVTFFSVFLFFYGGS